MISLAPLGGTQAASLEANEEVKCISDASAREVLFAYNICRGVTVLPSSADGVDLASISEHVRPLVAAHRLALDKLAPQE